MPSVLVDGGSPSSKTSFIVSRLAFHKDRSILDNAFTFWEAALYAQAIAQAAAGIGVIERQHRTTGVGCTEGHSCN